MKRLGIYLGPFIKHWDSKTVESGMNGSETWAVEVSKELSKLGYDITIYGYPEQIDIINEHLRIVDSIQFIDDIRKQVRYDYFIYSRKTDMINQYLNCNRCYLMLHDTHTLDGGSVNNPLIKNIGYLSAFHKHTINSAEFNMHAKSTPDDKFRRVTNGFSREFYEEFSELPKENSMVWSSSIDRGFYWLYEKVLLDVIKVVPDFKIYLCGVQSYMTDIKKLESTSKLLPNVEYVGALSKRELARYQCKSKVWVYPGWFPETFCITAVENGYAKNALITPKSYGLGDTLRGYNIVDIPLLEPDSEKELADAYKDITIRCLKDESFRRMLAESAFQVCSQYSWTRAARDWDKIFRESDISNDVITELYDRYRTKDLEIFG